MSIDLNESQQAKWQELMNYILLIEKELNVTVDQTNGENIAFVLNSHRELLGSVGKMMELASAIFNWAKGQAADEAMADNKVLNLKADIQRKWFDGRLAKYHAVYERAERAHKSLETSIKGLITLLSYDKTLTIRNT